MDNGKTRKQDFEDEPPRAQAGIFKIEKKAGKKTKKNTATDGSRRVKKNRNNDGEKEKAETTNQMKTQPLTAPTQGHPHVEAWVQRALDIGVEKLREEFRLLAKYTRPNMTQDVFNQNNEKEGEKSKNR